MDAETRARPRHIATDARKRAGAGGTIRATPVEIGEPKRTITIEPIEEPAPTKAPLPAEPHPEREPEPAKEPAPA
jgi:hypothetical protein